MFARRAANRQGVIVGFRAMKSRTRRGSISDECCRIHSTTLKCNLALKDAQSLEEFCITFLEFSGYIERSLHGDDASRVYLVSIAM